MDSNPSHDSVCFEGASTSSPDHDSLSFLLNAGNRFAYHYLHTFLLIKIVQKECKVLGEDVLTNCLTTNNQGRFFIDKPQRGSHLRTDETSADHNEIVSFLGQRTQLFIVSKVTIVNDIAVAGRQMIGCSTRGKQQFVICVFTPFIVKDRFF